MTPSFSTIATLFNATGAVAATWNFFAPSRAAKVACLVVGGVGVGFGLTLIWLATGCESGQFARVTGRDIECVAVRATNEGAP